MLVSDDIMSDNIQPGARGDTMLLNWFTKCFIVGSIFLNLLSSGAVAQDWHPKYKMCSYVPFPISVALANTTLNRLDNVHGWYHIPGNSCIDLDYKKLSTPRQRRIYKYLRENEGSSSYLGSIRIFAVGVDAKGDKHFWKPRIDGSQREYCINWLDDFYIATENGELNEHCDDPIYEKVEFIHTSMTKDNVIRILPQKGMIAAPKESPKAKKNDRENNSAIGLAVVIGAIVGLGYAFSESKKEEQKACMRRCTKSKADCYDLCVE